MHVHVHIHVPPVRTCKYMYAENNVPALCWVCAGSPVFVPPDVSGIHDHHMTRTYFMMVEFPLCLLVVARVCA
jgi:hypothetical protein